jgi:PKD repeat protein
VDGRYVTLATNAGTLAGVHAVSNPSPGNVPSGVTFPVGFFEFTVQGVVPGSAAIVSLYLPPGVTINRYLKFGPEPTNTVPHWYDFAFNTASGTGWVAGSNPVQLHFRDGQRGDDDLTANGSIVDPGALAFDPMAPAITGLSVDSTVLTEGGRVSLSGSFSDASTADAHTVVIDWGDGNTDTLPLPAGSRTFSATHGYPDDDPTGTPSDRYTIRVRVVDGDGAADAVSIAVMVNNAAPALVSLASSSSAVGGAREGETVTLSAAFTDVGTLDTHTATIDWGDGTTTAGAVIESGGAGLVAAGHAYAAGGIYTVTLTLNDDDAGSVVRTVTVFVSGAGMRGDELHIIGTAADDRVTVSRHGASQFKVHANFFPEGASRTYSAAGISRIVVVTGAGDDRVTIGGNIDLIAILDGGDGDDRLQGGGGPSILLGGDGNDRLRGGGGRDLLIGGRGADRIAGNRGEDLLVGGFTAFDSDYAALLAALAEWNSERDSATRLANLRGAGAGPRANGVVFLISEGSGRTVFDDAAHDVLTGAAGEDWFLADRDGAAWDSIVRLLGDELADDLDP